MASLREAAASYDKTLAKFKVFCLENGINIPNAPQVIAPEPETASISFVEEDVSKLVLTNASPNFTPKKESGPNTPVDVAVVVTDTNAAYHPSTHATNTI